MKTFLINIILLLAGNYCIAQSALPLDDRGKYIQYEIVEAKGVSKDSLANRAQYFLKNYEKKYLQHHYSASDSVFNADGKFVIAKTKSMLSHPSGEVLYHFVAEVKDGKYRYWLTDFKFVPYQRDRYGNFVPVMGVNTPLENSPGKLNAAVWKDYVEATADLSKKFGAEFKQRMAISLQAKPTKPVSPVSTGKW